MLVVGTAVHIKYAAKSLYTMLEIVLLGNA